MILLKVSETQSSFNPDIIFLQPHTVLMCQRTVLGDIFSPLSLRPCVFISALQVDSLQNNGYYSVFKIAIEVGLLFHPVGTAGRFLLFLSMRVDGVPPLRNQAIVFVVQPLHP